MLGHKNRSFFNSQILFLQLRIKILWIVNVLLYSNVLIYFSVKHFFTVNILNRIFLNIPFAVCTRMTGNQHSPYTMKSLAAYYLSIFGSPSYYAQGTFGIRAYFRLPVFGGFTLYVVWRIQKTQNQRVFVSQLIRQFVSLWRRYLLKKSS